MGISVVRKTLNVPEIKRRLYQKAAPYGAVPAIPVEISYQHRNVRMRVIWEIDTFTQRWSENLVTPAKGMNLNGRELLEVFSSIRVPDELVPFLEFCGPFRSRGLDAQSITWDEFQQWQRFLYAVRSHEKQLPWPDPSPFTDWALMEAVIDPQPDMPHLVSGRRTRVMEFHPQTALEYMGTVAYVDYLREVELRVCKLPTCKKLFERSSAREQFCCCIQHTRQLAKNTARKAAAEVKSNAKA